MTRDYRSNQVSFMNVRAYPELAQPAATIWVVSAPSWACIDPTIPRFDGQAPPAG